MELYHLIGQCLLRKARLMVTKYYDVPNDVIQKDFYRLTKQLWKLIPMREKGEDWQKQLNLVTIEIAGLSRLFNAEVDYLILLSKLEGLDESIAFMDYRKAIFDSIDLLKKLMTNE